MVLISLRVIYELLTDIREHVGILYKLIEVIAELDVATSLAQVSSSKNYVRPTFGPNLYIQEGRNPILESVSSSIPVPNDTVSRKKYFMAIIEREQNRCIPGEPDKKNYLPGV